MTETGLFAPSRQTPLARTRSLLGITPVITAVAAVCAAVALLGNAPRVIGQITWNSDAAGPMVLAETLHRAGQAGRITAVQPSYIWLDSLVAGLPGHRFIWLALAPLTAVVTAVLVALAVRRIAGGWAAIAAATLALSGGPALAYGYLAPAFHGIAWMLTALCGLVVVSVSALDEVKRRDVVVACAAAVLIGVGAATDVVVVATGIAPLSAVAAWLMWRRRADAGVTRRARLLAAVVAVSVGALMVTQVLMHIAGYSSGLPGGGQRSVASPAVLLHHAYLLGRDLLDIADGGMLTGASAASAPAAVLLIVVAVLAVTAVVIRRARMAGGHDDVAARAHMVFWLLSSALLIGAFLFSGIVVEGTGSLPGHVRLLASERYLAPLLLAAAALVPLWPRSAGRRLLVAAAVATIAVVNGTALTVAAGEGLFRPAAAASADDVLGVLRAHGLTRGYASYWLADALTWKSDGAVTVLPVAETPFCGSAAADPGLLCPMADESMSGDYAVRPGPSFVVVDPGADYVRAPLSATLGAPQQVYRVGDVTIDVFAGDVAARFLSTCAGRSDHRC